MSQLKLSREQKSLIKEYAEEYKRIGLALAPGNKEKAEAAVTASYLSQGYKKPKFEWFPSPEQGSFRAAQLAEDTEVPTKKQIKKQAKLASYGSLDSYWVAFYAYLQDMGLIEPDPLIDIVKDIVTHCGVYWTFEDIVVMTEKPTAIHLKDNELHNLNGLALEYVDGTGVYAINGKRLTEEEYKTRSLK